jgi:putative tryptophan/tyrosine transport system substrate-binding protein
MRRREFITLVGGAVTWPLAARAQQPSMPAIGLITTGSPAETLHLVATFREGLKEVGYVEGQNVLVEYRWAENQYDRLPALATDLVHRQVQVIVATTVASWMPAKAATSIIPIVFQGGGDPVKFGLVASLNRPGGNATGVINISAELTAKRLDVLRELLPSATLIAVLTNPNSPISEEQLRDLVVSAKDMHQETYVVDASSKRKIDEAFATAVQRHADALLVLTDSFFTNRREQLIAVAARHAIPVMYPSRDFADAGGLISYGAKPCRRMA